MDFFSVFLFFVFIVGGATTVLGLGSLLEVISERALGYIWPALAFLVPGLLLLTCGLLLWQ